MVTPQIVLLLKITLTIKSVRNLQTVECKMGVSSTWPSLFLFAFAGCPLIMFKESLYDKFPMMNEKDQGAVCLSLIYAGNWIIEVKSIVSLCLSRKSLFCINWYLKILKDLTFLTMNLRVQELEYSELHSQVIHIILTGMFFLEKEMVRVSSRNKNYIFRLSTYKIIP